MRNICYSLLLVNIALLSACSSKLSTQSPADIDLSGTWLLNTTYSQDVVLSQSRGRGGEGARGGRGGEGGGRGGPPGGGGGGGGGGERGERPEGGKGSKGRGPKQKKSLAMTAKEMTITQNSDSMGIAYVMRAADGSTSYRDIEWGKTEQWDKEVKAGWNDDNQLVIETSGEKGNFTETYQLNAGGRVLTLIIDVNGSDHGGEYRRVYERKGVSK